MIYHKILNLLLYAMDIKLGNRNPWSYPYKVHIEVNDYCNLRCRMCGRQNESIPKNTGEISFELIEKMAPLFKRALYVGLAGNGEPFLHSKIFEIIEFIVKHKATPSIITNATLLNEERIQRLTEIKPLILQASVDSAVPEIYEKVREGAKFDKVRDNLLRLNEVKKLKGTDFPLVLIIACLMQETINEVERLVDFAVETGVRELIFQNILPYNPEMEKSKIRMLEEGQLAVDRARKHAEGKGVNIIYHPISFGVDRYAPVQNSAAMNSFCCDNIRNLFHVELNGNVRYCCFWSGDKVGNLNQEDPVEIWKSTQFARLRKSLADGIIPKSCENCYILKPKESDAEFKNALRMIRDTFKNRKNFR